jgi:hypothetical protein
MALKKCKECGKDVSTKSKKCPHCGSPVSQGITVKGVIKWTILLFIGFTVYTCASITSEVTEKLDDKKETNNQSIENTELDFKWNTGESGLIMEADLTITNNNAYPIKDITVKCAHFAKSKTQIDSNSETFYDIIPAYESKSFRDINMGFIHNQAHTSSCRITQALKQE